MNSVSPSTAQYGGAVMQDEMVDSRRTQSLEQQASFGHKPSHSPDPSREATGEPDEVDKLKAKLMSAWNNVKYGELLVLKEECHYLYYITVSIDTDRGVNVFFCLFL